MWKFSLFIFVIQIFSCKISQDKPNVLFILVDDLGWSDLSCLGSTFYHTPNIDRLSRKSVLFTHAYSASPVCSPTRAAIMTGKHPIRVNITDWIPGMPLEEADNPTLKPPEDLHNLPLQEVTLAEALKSNGYRTGFVGKWHLGLKEEFWPEAQGFDVNVGGFDKGSPPGGYYSPYENPKLPDGSDEEYLTDRLTNESLDFIIDHKKDPFFLFLAFYTVHTPIEGCSRYDDEYQMEQQLLPEKDEIHLIPERNGQTRINQNNYKYAAMVRSMDYNVGRILSALDSLKLSDNTVIVFTSDNGGLSTTKNGGPTSVLPFRGGKGWCYEGGIRVPGIVYCPWMQDGGKVMDMPVISMDFYPTILELAGISSSQNQRLDGINLVPYMENPASKVDRALVWHYPHYHGSTWTPGSAIRKGRYKLIEFYEEQKVELYDLRNDPGEKKDIALQNPEKVLELLHDMKSYIDERGGSYPIPYDQ